MTAPTKEHRWIVVIPLLIAGLWLLVQLLVGW
jgi:hypothetical protein